MSFECPDCKKGFTTKQNKNKHIKNDTCKKTKHQCKYCKKYYATSSGMYRHVRDACKVKKDNDEKKEEIYNQLLLLQEENKLLKNQLKQSNKIINKTINNKNKTINNINNINNGTINNNIILVGYGKEDMSKIDHKEILKGLRNGFYSTVKLTDTIHFNPKYPEYHNIYISNIKDKYGMMYDGKDWTLVPKAELIDKIYDNKKNYIEENVEEFYDSLSLSRKRALERWFDTDEEHEKIKEIKEKIKLLLYNKRHIVLNSKNGLLDD